MKQFFIKIGRFFWSWGFLKFVLAVIALVILLYVEEDWRGAHEWAATKAKWEAKGETFDYSKFIPPPVPDEQNLAAIPLFKLEPTDATYGKPYMDTVALKKAMRSDLPSLEFISTGSWQKGELPDMADIRKKVAGNYAIACPGTKPPEDALAQFNAIYPFLTDFLAAAATRPEFRINSNYAVTPPLSRPLGPVTAPLKLSKILALHAILALDQHQPELALQDVKVNFALASGIVRDPTLIGGLVGVGMAAINDEVVYDGLVQRAWTDAQLAELDRTLESFDFLSAFQFSIRSETAMSIESLAYFEKYEPRMLYGILKSDYFSKLTPPWPNGWWEENNGRIAEFRFRLVATVDPRVKLVFPKSYRDLSLQVERDYNAWDAFAPWKILAVVSNGPVANSVQHFAEAQVWVDEARIACALERYRLAQGVYPVALDALAPAYIDEVPHDIMNGQAYHYQVRADGTYLLYSVGWNQTDEGGTVAYKSGDSTVKQIDYDQGDWVWPTPKYAR